MPICYADLETFPIRPALLAPPPVVTAYAFGPSPVELVHAKLERDRSLALWHEILANHTLVGHNIVFDLAVLAAEWPELLEPIFTALKEGRVKDTMIRQMLFDVAEGKLGDHYGPNGQYGYGLADLMHRFFGVTRDKDTWRLRYGELADTPIERWEEGAREYPRTDVADARALYDNQERLNLFDQYLKDQDRQTRAAWWIQLMMCWGMRTDASRIDAVEKHFRAELEAARKLLLPLGLVRKNGSRDTKAARARIVQAFQAKGLPLPLTKTGLKKQKNGETFNLEDYCSVDETACEDSGDEVMIAYAKLTSAGNKISKDVPALRQGVHYPIQPRFSVLQETGRTGSTGGINDPGPLYTYQAQNMARTGGIRECFRARKGRVLVSRDYSGMELHTWSQCCITLLGHSRLGEKLNAGLDAHLELGARLVHKTYEEALVLKKTKDPEIMNARQCGKVGNFGLPGGLGAVTLVAYAKGNYGVLITEAEAKNIVSTWKEMWPEAVDWLAFINRLLRASTKRNHFGKPVCDIEQLFVGRIRGGCTFTEAANGFFQGLASDAAKYAGFLIAEECYTKKGSSLYGSRLWNFVHDEFVLECPEDRASDAYYRLGELMEEAGRRYCPDCPPRTEGAIMRHFSKDAYEKKDSSGRVIPYED